MAALARVIWNSMVRCAGVAPDRKVTAAFARCVPTLRFEQLIVNVKSPLEAGEETVLTFLPSTKNATEAIDVPDTEAFARFATLHWDVRSFADPCRTGTAGAGPGVGAGAGAAGGAAGGARSAPAEGGAAVGSGSSPANAGVTASAMAARAMVRRSRARWNTATLRKSDIG